MDQHADADTISEPRHETTAPPAGASAAPVRHEREADAHHQPLSTPAAGPEGKGQGDDAHGGNRANSPADRDGSGPAPAEERPRPPVRGQRRLAVGTANDSARPPILLSAETPPPTSTPPALTPVVHAEAADSSPNGHAVLNPVNPAAPPNAGAGEDAPMQPGQRPLDQGIRRQNRHGTRRAPGGQLDAPPVIGRPFPQGQQDRIGRPAIPSVPLPPVQRSQPPVINPRPPRPRAEPRDLPREPRDLPREMRIEREPPVLVQPGQRVGGYLVALNGGRFVLRDKSSLHTNSADIAINPGLVRTLGLRSGDMVAGTARNPRQGERLPELMQVETVNELAPDLARNRPKFDTLTPTFPNRQIMLERPSKLTGRVIDLMAPIGFGSRVLIVSPPKAGKTTVLKEIALAVTERYPEAVVILCLVGERPEEVTDLRTTVTNAEVIGSTFDEAVEFHVELAELTIERAKRLVEAGKDVVLLLDSITRLTRAYNLADTPQGEYRASGRTLSGGIDASALYPPKRFFGAARACMEGGSITVVASCLVDTGSRMEDVIYEELKGTGNSELVLDRHLAEERIFPAIDINRSSTRREELLLGEQVLPVVVRLRRALAPLNSTVASRFLLEQLAATANNEAFIARISGDREWARSVPRGNGEEDLGFGQRPGRY